VGTYLSIHFGTKDEYDHLVRVIRAGIAKGSLRLVSLRVDDQDVESISLRELLPYLRRQGIHVRPELAELAKARGILRRTQGIVVGAEIRDLLQETKARKGDKREGAQPNEGQDAPGETNENTATAIATKRRSRARYDSMSREIEKAITQLTQLGEEVTPYRIMDKLKSFAGSDGSCITDAGSDNVRWRRASGDPEKLTMTLLKKRLRR
jgi:hypothetical protein